MTRSTNISPKPNPLLPAHASTAQQVACWPNGSSCTCFHWSNWESVHAQEMQEPRTAGTPNGTWHCLQAEALPVKGSCPSQIPFCLFIIQCSICCELSCQPLVEAVTASYARQASWPAAIQDRDPWKMTSKTQGMDTASVVHADADIWYRMRTVPHG